jgi:hypothetical protein
MADTLQEMYREIDRLKRRFERFESGEYINTKAHAVFLTTPLTSTSWDGDSFSTTSKTLIDLSTVFGVPAGVKAVLFSIYLRDSGSAAGTCDLILSPNNTDLSGLYTACSGVANNMFVGNGPTVPCDANGDVYYQIRTSGVGTMDIYLEVWGYWL